PVQARRHRPRRRRHLHVPGPCKRQQQILRWAKNRGTSKLQWNWLKPTFGSCGGIFSRSRTLTGVELAKINGQVPQKRISRSAAELTASCATCVTKTRQRSQRSLRRPRQPSPTCEIGIGIGPS